MCRGDDSLALADFGISKKINSNTNLTTLGQIMGTPHYMSPEQGEGGIIDIRTDLYSAGVMLYELLAREKPFSAPSPAALIYKHVNEEIPMLPEGLNRFQGVVDKLMAKKPDDRYSSAMELVKALEPLE